MSTPDWMGAALRLARELADCVQQDDTGSMIAGEWRGGNGGLLSRNTLAKADELRRALDMVKRHEAVL